MPKAKEQWEEEAIERFRNFLGRERGFIYAITGRDVEVNPATHENFDYQLQTQEGAKVAVEVTRLVESGKDLAKQKVWGNMIAYLKKELLKRGVKGYLISSPEFWVKKKEIPAYTAKLAVEIEQAVKNNDGTEKFNCGSFVFNKIKSLETVVFSSHISGVRNIDSSGIVKNCFAANLPRKNNQVAISGHERILLVINWALFIDGTDVIHALSDFDFSRYQNVDKIFFESGEGKIALVYDHAVAEAIKNNQPAVDLLSWPLILEYLKYQLGDKKPEAFNYVKSVTNLTGDINWLADNGAKENLIMCGDELLKKDLLDDAMWIVRQLHDDKNPKADGSNDDNDPKGEYNYHTRILRGENDNIITTVRGHLCWLMTKIVAKNKPEYYAEIIEIMSRYLKEDNLYIRAQVSHIMEVLWSNRLAIKNRDESPFVWKKEERVFVRQLVLNTVRSNCSYPRIMHSLLHVFNINRDLNETEAEEMLKLFLRTNNNDILHDLAAYIVYFAFFREKDSQYYGGAFNPKFFIALLKEQIKNGASSMRHSLAWHLWKLLTDKILPYEALKEYFPLFLEGKHAHEAISKLTLIIEALSAIAPNDAINLFERALESFEHYLSANPKDGYLDFIDGAEEILPILAKEPKRLITAIRRLKNIRVMKTQIYIGNIQTLFASYQLVSSEHREETKIELKFIYDELKAAIPQLQEINWIK